jgi:hypothetical protein
MMLSVISSMHLVIEASSIDQTEEEGQLMWHYHMAREECTPTCLKLRNLWPAPSPTLLCYILPSVTEHKLEGISKVRVPRESRPGRRIAYVAKRFRLLPTRQKLPNDESQKIKQ